MKKLLSLLVGLLLLAQANAAEATYTANNMTNSHLVGNYVITKISLTSVSNAIVNLYDSSVASITNSHPAYTITTTYATNMISIITNTLGFLQTNTYPGVYSLALTVAAGTDALPTLTSISCAANTLTTLSGLSLSTTRGLASVGQIAGGVSTTNSALIVTYRAGP